MTGNTSGQSNYTLFVTSAIPYYKITLEITLATCQYHNSEKE